MEDSKKKLDQKVSLNINLDTTPILYTDNIFMTVNKFGLILDVGQKVGDQIRIVARLGMSREHAKKFVTELGKLLVVTEGKHTSDDTSQN